MAVTAHQVADGPATARNFHAGETTLQAESGVDTRSLDRDADSIFDPRMAAGEQRFVQDRTFSVAATFDEQGRPWATPLIGPPGELFTVLDETTVTIRPREVDGDRLSRDVDATGQLGVLFLEPARRRRATSVGRAQRRADGAIRYRTTRFFGLCPRYIFRRVHEPPDAAAAARGAAAPVVDDRLGADDRAQLAGADTVFLASHSAEHGTGATHRGGPSGFVTVVDDTTLRLPDYLGNGMYQTLGNLLLIPRIGLMSIDLDTGRTVQVTGHGSIDVPGEADQHAERVLVLDIDEVRTTWRDPGRWTDVAEFDMRLARRNPVTPMLPSGGGRIVAHPATA